MEQIKLHLKPYYADLLIGSKGRNIKLLAKKYSAQIWILQEQLQYLISNPTLILRVSSYKAESIKLLVDELHLKANEITITQAKLSRNGI
jgi:hypothetical protein